MKSKSVLRRLEQLEKRVMPPKRRGEAVVYVYDNEVVEDVLAQYDGYEHVYVIIEDEVLD